MKGKLIVLNLNVNKITCCRKIFKMRIQLHDNVDPSESMEEDINEGNQDILDCLLEEIDYAIEEMEGNM